MSDIGTGKRSENAVAGNEIANDHMGMVIDAAPVAMMVVDQTGTIRIANRRACETFEYSVDKLVGMHVPLVGRSGTTSAYAVVT